MAFVVGQQVRHLGKPEWGVGEVVEVRGEKLLIYFEHSGEKLLKNAPLSDVGDARVISDRPAKKPKGRRSKRRKALKPDVEPSLPSVSQIISPEPAVDEEFEAVLALLARISKDIGPNAEPNTALLLYALFQTPGTVAQSYLGALDPSLRARLVVEAWQGAQDRHFGIPLEHIRYAARRAAMELCHDPLIDSRHLLLVCLAGSGWLATAPGAPVGYTESRYVLGRSTLAVRAMEYAGVDALAFLERVRQARSADAPIEHPFPSFYVLWSQSDRTRVLRVEEVGEFLHSPDGKSAHPATVGLLDGSVGKSLEALLEFEGMLNDSRTPELAYQRFFERHPEFLLSDEHLAVRPGVLLQGSEGFGLKPDFFLQRRDSPFWDLAELKLPTEKLVQGRPARRGLAAAVRWGMDQLRQYREYFLDSTLSKRFHQTHGLELYHPKLTLIIGRDEAFGTYYERQRLAPPESRILTFDDLLRFAKHRSLVMPFARRVTPR